MAKSSPSINVCPGQLVTYTVSVTNIGNLDGTNLVITDTLPNSFAFNTTTATTTRWSLGKIVSRETKTVSYSARVSPNAPAGKYKNHALATIDNPGSAGATADADFVVTVSDTCSSTPDQPILELDKTTAQPFSNPGGTYDFTLTVVNSGTITATNVVVTDILPNGFIAADSITRWNIGDLAPEASHTIAFKVNVGILVAPGDYTNIAKAVADNYGEVIADAPMDIRTGTVLGMGYQELPNTGPGATMAVYFKVNLLALLAGVTLNLILRKKIALVWSNQ